MKGVRGWGEDVEDQGEDKEVLEGLGGGLRREDRSETKRKNKGDGRVCKRELPNKNVWM